MSSKHFGIGRSSNSEIEADDAMFVTASASDAVFVGIVRGLEAQTFVPGQRLVESDLMAQFGVGRNSVREALQRLVAVGLLEVFRHRGAAIRSLSLPETMDVLDVAERMTGLLARSAACCAGKAADARHTRTLKHAVAALDAAERASDSMAFAAARRHFYRALLEMGGNRELKRLFPTIQMSIVHAQFRLPDLQRLRLADYRRIATVVLTGNASEAEAAGAAHVENVRAAIRAAFQQGLTPSARK